MPDRRDELVTRGAVVTLRDGSRVRIRQCHRTDDELLVRGFERVGMESRYRRFLTPVPALTKRMVRHLTQVDHHDHEALIALDESPGEGIGIARYVRNPHRPGTAEAAVTVVDDWQRRGLGTLLLEAIGARARAEGITTFTAMVLANNRPIRDLIEALAPARIVDHELSTVEVEVPIGELEVAPELKKLLDIAARHDVFIGSPSGTSDVLCRASTGTDPRPRG